MWLQDQHSSCSRINQKADPHEFALGLQHPQKVVGPSLPQPPSPRAGVGGVVLTVGLSILSLGHVQVLLQWYSLNAIELLCWACNLSQKPFLLILCLSRVSYITGESMSLSLENPCMPTIAVELSSSAFAPWLLYIRLNLSCWGFESLRWRMERSAKMRRNRWMRHSKQEDTTHTTTHYSSRNPYHSSSPVFIRKCKGGSLRLCGFVLKEDILHHLFAGWRPLIRSMSKDWSKRWDPHSSVRSLRS